MEKTITILRSRLFLALFFASLLRELALWAFITGSAVLCLRFMAGSSATLKIALPGSLLILLVLGIMAYVKTARRIPDDRKLCALLDEYNFLGGAACAEADGVDMSGRFEEGTLHIPGFKFHVKDISMVLLLCVVFLVGAIAIPLPASVSGGDAAALRRPVLALKEKLDEVKDEGIISEEEAAKFKEQLNTLMDKSDTNDINKSWESLDYIDESLKKKEMEVAKNETASFEALEKATSEMTELLNSFNDGKCDEEALSKEMAQMLAEFKEGFNGDTIPELAGMDPMKLTPEQMKRLLEKMKNAKFNAEGKLKALAELKVLTPEELERILNGEDGNAGDGDGESAIACIAMPGLPGSGGVDRGRGDAGLGFLGDTKQGAERFKAQILPESRLADSEHSEVKGVSFGEAAPSGNVAVSTGALTGVSSGSTGTAKPAVVLPRHKKAVEGYFKHKK